MGTGKVSSRVSSNVTAVAATTGAFVLAERPGMTVAAFSTSEGRRSRARPPPHLGMALSMYIYAAATRVVVLFVKQKKKRRTAGLVL